MSEPASQGVLAPRAPRTRSRQRWLWVLQLAGLLAVLLGGIAWLVLRPDGPQGPAIDTSTVQGLRIKTADQPAIVLKRTGQTWQITEPVVLRGNPARIEPLLGLTHSGLPGYTPDEVDMTETGLDEPLAQVQIDNMNIELGGPDLSGERQYIRREGRIALVPGWFASLLQGGVASMADLRLFPDGLEQLTQIGPDGQDTRLDETLWASLSARDIVLLEDLSLPDTNQVTLRSQTPSGNGIGLTLHWQGEKAWLVPDAAGFAYALPASAVPGLADGDP